MAKEKNNNWYTKPRRFDSFVRWIIFNPKALSILMVMGHIIAVILFLIFFIVSMIYLNFFMKLFSLGLLIITLYNLYKYYRFQKKTGSIFEHANVNDMVFSGKKQ